MKSIVLMIIICALPLMVGCQSNAKFSCAGWSKPPKANDTVRMVKEENQLTRWIVSTDRFGQKQGCWK